MARWLAAASCAVATAVHAGPPFLTDDPEPVDLGHAEVNAIWQETRTVDGRSGALSGEVNIGCARETQCHAAVPLAVDRPDAGPHRAGLGDVEAGVKYRFLVGFNLGLIAEVAPHLNLLLSAGRGLTNVQADRRSVFLALQREL
ncbi:MAG TPA: hypothetical protein VF453_00680 [Burkholderiaceae bacterium]